MKISELTWTCHICNKSRPDDKISVYKKDIGHENGLPEGIVQQNIRYCNDDISCREAAENYDHFKNSESKKAIHLDVDDEKKKKVTFKDYTISFFAFFFIVSLVNTSMSVLLNDDVEFFEKVIDPSSIIIRIVIAALLSWSFTKKFKKKV